MKAIVSLALVLLCAAPAFGQSSRIPGRVRLKVRTFRLTGAMGGKAAGVAPGALASEARGAANANGPVVQAPVSRVDNTTVILGDQISVSGRR